MDVLACQLHADALLDDEIIEIIQILGEVNPVEGDGGG